MERLKTVLLLIESSRAYGRGCLAGVAAYIRAHPHWHAHHIERSLVEAPPPSLRRFDADGIVTRTETTEMAAALDALGCPAVDLRGMYPPRNGTSFDTDPEACSKLAADHFLDRGFRNVAFCGYPGVAFSDQRCQLFVACVSARGFSVEVFGPSQRSARKTDTIAREADAEFAEHGLDAWLDELPKPVAIFACNDVRARQVLIACKRTGINVPDDVAVLGVDNDEVICDLSFPPLSSVVPNTWEIGYQGATLLDQLMSGGSVPQARVLIPPEGVHVRRSSDVVAVEDRDLAAALRYIRDHACEGITVQDVVRRLPISRPTLDRRFQDTLGRSPKDEIDRIRTERARSLLDLTSHKIAVIADMVGYGTASQFVTAFKRSTGVTPGTYRKRGSLST